MFSLDPEKLFIVLIVALVLLGLNRDPEVAARVIARPGRQRAPWLALPHVNARSARRERREQCPQPLRRSPDR